jgi:hypothetical protein
MKLCKKQIIQGCLFLLAAVPAIAQTQRGMIGIDVGEASDKFGGLPRYTDPAGDVNGEVVVLPSNPKENWPDVVAGGEVRFPTDTNHHSTEIALHGGFQFHVTPTFFAGFDVGLRKIYVPPSIVDGQTFTRNNMELLETPLFLEYRFGPEKHVFARVEGAPEYHPRFKAGSHGPSPLPNPDLDHGYFLRGSLGYNFGRWYAKAGYESRYFKFASGLANPNGYNNWRSDMATAGVGLSF